MDCWYGCCAKSAYLGLKFLPTLLYEREIATEFGLNLVVCISLVEGKSKKE